jgi:integrase
MVLFAAATGVRPSELFALEHGDVDRRAGVVQIRRAYANGRVKQTKTRLSRRAVPLQATAVEALDQLRPRPDSPLLFPNARGGHLDFRNFNRRHWKPAQKALGIDPPRDLYDLRHTYATFALRAGVPVFAVSRFMGTSIAMIDLHYGHLAVDSFEHAVSLLDALALERAVDAGWTPAQTPAMRHRHRVSASQGRRSRRPVDARWTPRSETAALTAHQPPH